jgi:hypothetical protein
MYNLKEFVHWRCKSEAGHPGGILQRTQQVTDSEKSADRLSGDDHGPQNVAGACPLDPSAQGRAGV